MPNHITNRLTVIGEEEQVKKVLDFIKIEEETDKEVNGIGTIDFNKITPMPKWVFSGNLGIYEEEKYGEENCWHKWSIKNWGTKWNAYAQPDERSAENTVYFQTAWNGVPKLIEKIAWIFPDVTIEYSYCSEDFGYNVAKYIFKDTDSSSYVPDGGSKEAYELAMDICKCTAEDENLVYDEEIDNYRYCYREEE